MENNIQYNIRFTEKEINIILKALDEVTVKASEIQSFQRMINRIKNYKNYQVRSSFVAPKSESSVIKEEKEEIIEEKVNVNEMVANVLSSGGSGVLINPSPETMEALSMIGEIIDTKTEIEEEIISNNLIVEEISKEVEKVKELELETAPPEEEKEDETLKEFRPFRPPFDIKKIVETTDDELEEESIEDNNITEEKETNNSDIDNIVNSVIKENNFRFSSPENNFNLKEQIIKLKDASEVERLSVALSGFAQVEE